MNIRLTFDCKRITEYGRIVFILLFVNVISACNNGSDLTDGNGLSLSDTGAFRASLTWPENTPRTAKGIDCTLSGISKIRGTMFDENDAELTSAEFECTAHNGTIDNIPQGSNRRVVITGLDSNGHVIYRGEETGITITGGSITPGGEILMTAVWNKTFKRSVNESARSVQETSDGGFIIAVSSESFDKNKKDVWLIKTYSDGIIEWDNHFVGGGNDSVRSVQETSDGGFIIAASYIGGIGGSDAWLIKTDSAGEKEWNDTFGGSGISAASAQETSDGGFIIAGFTSPYDGGESDAWLIKTDSAGDEQWHQPLEGGDYPYSVQETSDGGFIIAVSTSLYDGGKSDALLIKTDSAGEKEWRSLPFGKSDYDYASSVQETSDGGFIFAGSTRSFGAGESDAWLIKTDSAGFEEDGHKTFGGSDSDLARSVQETSDGGFIIAGSTRSFGAGESDVWLIKTYSDGSEQWNKTFGGSDSDDAYSVQETSDGGYIIAGSTRSFGDGSCDAWVIKTDKNGNTAPFTLE